MEHEGSSPHTRGAPGLPLPTVAAGGIIPAYAGSTPGMKRRSGSSQDHPRIRGEHGMGSPHPAHLQGSSPHTRGAQKPRHEKELIPLDHPRIRGEHLRRPPGVGSAVGSSPHTRGARRLPGDPRRQRRIIPAYAGSTRRPDTGVQVVLGSSPHTRGALAACADVPEISRIIPAYAGSTNCDRLLYYDTEDHPRIRGEHIGAGDDHDAAIGSSPHTRGAQLPGLQHLFHERIIPAYAGSTATWTAASISRTDHPRIRGEHAGFGAIVDPEGGIIPAYAGSTLMELALTSDCRDHPRIGGEHFHHLVWTVFIEGSSPHTRGAPPWRQLVAERCGIIPAYAGSTARGGWAGVCRADHPRIRGEHVAEMFKFPLHPGSSPHTRGALCEILHRGPNPRIIPAYAGSTLQAYETGFLARDHPRIRGEHNALRDRVTVYSGSSPHTRGALESLNLAEDVVGIIPAYAGSTSAPALLSARTVDHPRIRGEHWSASWLAAVPPWIIPAYAGSTSWRRWPSPGRRDHPRIRGEHPGRAVRKKPVAGSSPHTRGALVGDGFLQFERWDHPRIRGEHYLRRGSSSRTSGSSPHTRGAHVAEGHAVGGVRIIPAYAGSTVATGAAETRPEGSSPHTRGARSAPASPTSNARIIPAYAGSTRQEVAQLRRRQDHPRIRGEHGFRPGCQAVSGGSSPHTRGARAARRRGRRPARIIPAYAGSTKGSIPVPCWRRGSSPHTRGARRRSGIPPPKRRIIPAYAGSTGLSWSRKSSGPDHPRIRGEHLYGAGRLVIGGGSSPHTRGARLG